MVANMTYFGTKDPLVVLAEREVFASYSDTVSVMAKGKSLNKHGINRAVGNSWETVAEMQGSTSEETYVSTNLIDSIVSDAANTADIYAEASGFLAAVQ